MKNKIKKLTTKLTLLFTGFALVMGVLICLFSYRNTWNQATEAYSVKALQAARLGASYVDGDHIAEYLETGETDEAYDQMEETFRRIKRNMGLSYFYIFIPSSDHFTYVLDVRLEEEDPEYFSPLGDVFEYTDLEYDRLVPDVQAKRESQGVIVATSSFAFGTNLSTWAPVLDSEGNLAAMVEADVAVGQVEATIRSQLLVMICVYLALILLMVIFQSFVLRRMLTVPLKKLTDRVLDFASEGSLSRFEDDIRTGDELQTLSESFGKMALDITAYTQQETTIAADRERIATELSVATSMQESMIPREMTDFPGMKYMDVHGEIKTSRNMGGNFYDYFNIDDHRVAVVMGGIQETGISAAMMLVVGRTIIRSQFFADRTLTEITKEINKQIYESMEGQHAIPAFVGILDVSDGRFTYINAGYNPPVIMRPGDRYEFMAGAAYVPLGVSENISYREMNLQMRQGDRLLLYSDGVISARGKSGESYGAERLRTRLNADRNREVSLEQLIQGVIQDTASFSGTGEAEKDQVLLALEYKRGNRDMAQITLPPEMARTRELQGFLREQLSMNGIEGKPYAQIQVCAEELFAVCCRRARGAQIEVECAVPSPELLTIRMSMSLRGPNPLEDEGDSVIQSAADFIRRHSEKLEWMQLDGRWTLLMTRRLEVPAAVAVA